MTYTRISRQGKETFKDEAEYLKKHHQEQADAQRRQALIAEGRKALALARTEEQIVAAYVAGDIEVWEMEEGLNHIYGIEGGDPPWSKSK